MNQNARKLVKALRSGRYAQARHKLTLLDHAGDPIGHCCLGVACDLYQQEVGGLEVLVEDQVIPDRPDGVWVLLYDGQSASLPPRVREWLGFTTHGGEYGKDLTDCLTDDNDRGKTFDEIADIIESEPEGLFE